MKMQLDFTKRIAMILALGLTTSFTLAGEVKVREQIQQDKIRQGEVTGQLTPGEAANLEAHAAKIEADRQRALSDGIMTPGERRYLNREENIQSRRIHRKKHNANFLW